MTVAVDTPMIPRPNAPPELFVALDRFAPQFEDPLEREPHHGDDALHKVCEQRRATLWLPGCNGERP
jgi:hypothetical protein